MSLGGLAWAKVPGSQRASNVGPSPSLRLGNCLCTSLCFRDIAAGVFIVSLAVWGRRVGPFPRLSCAQGAEDLAFVSDWPLGQGGDG